ncbi:MAG: hypothetical protein WD068_00385 [Candidatus Babeliales bacterium]
MVNPNDLDTKKNSHNDSRQQNSTTRRDERQGFLNRMRSVHNKMSRGAEQFWLTLKRTMSFGEKGQGNTHNKRKNNTLKRSR